MSDEKPGHFVDVESPYCAICSQRKVCDRVHFGCADYRQWYVENWNENIRRVPQARTQKKTVFAYEHPDLIREGITWQKKTTS